MKKIVAAITVCLFVFWTARIISINRNPPITEYYNIGDTMDCGDSCGEHKVLSICLNVTNKSNKDADIKEVRDFLEEGFESSSWSSAINPEVTKQINEANGESIAPGSTQKIWFVTEVNKMCFKDSTWKIIEELPFTYVLTLSPQKIAVRLDV